MWFSGVCASANTHPHDEPAVKMRTHDFHLAASDRLPFESYHAMCLGESRFNEDSLPSALHSRRHSPAPEARLGRPNRPPPSLSTPAYPNTKRQ
jgi:hypothetical protein